MSFKKGFEKKAGLVGMVGRGIVRGLSGNMTGPLKGADKAFAALNAQGLVSRGGDLSTRLNQASQRML